MSEHQTDFVVCAIIERDGKIFIAKRAETKKTWPGRFELIGGHVDLNESLEDALKREVKEEINVDIEVGRIVDAFTYTSDTFKVEICYLCHLPDGQEPQLNPEDHSEYKWIGPSEISLFEKDDEETRATDKAFKVLAEAMK